jgi:predicted NUDIX family NTP pyrophosphohydrolase
VPKTSAGLLVYRFALGAQRSASEPGVLEVLLVHPGGPIWAKKEEGAWSIPKGEYDEQEDPELCALREFEEELGVPPPPGHLHDLGETTQAGGKRVQAWALRGSLDVSEIRSNTFEMEWPPRSGSRRSFPEVDRAAWFAVDDARRLINRAQTAFLDRLLERVVSDEPG